MEQSTKDLITDVSCSLLSPLKEHPSKAHCLAAVVYASTAVINMKVIITDMLPERITEEERQELADNLFKLEW